MASIGQGPPALAGAVKRAVKKVLPKPVRRAIRRSLGLARSGPPKDAIAFYPKEKFPFTAVLEANWRDVLGELEVLEQGKFVEWPVKIYDGQSEAFGLYAFGRKIEENCRLCPKTTELVEQIPRLTTAGFSALNPKTHIRPHVGYTSSVLRCHLGLIIPDGCGIRVGYETRHWEQGKCMVFDDTLEHEAWNRGDSIRIVLLLDFVREGMDFDDRVSQDLTEAMARGEGGVPPG